MTTTTAAAPQSALVAALDRRFYAFAFDRLLGWTIVVGVGVAAWWWLFREDRALAGVLVVLVGLLVVGLAFAVLLGTRGTSPGKAAFGLRAVDPGSGRPIGVGRALVRTLILGLSGLPTFGLGTATLAWTAVEDPSGERRGWHDRKARSIVVDVRPVEVAVAVEDDRPRAVVNLTAMRLNPVRQPAAPAAPAAHLATPSAPPASHQPARPLTPSPPPANLRGRHAADPGPATVPPTGSGPTTRTRWRVAFDSGETFVVEGLGLVGRRPEGRAGEPVRHVVPLVSADMSISKTHAQFHLAADGALVVTDRGSTNGSILVRRGVSRELSAGRPATLLDGDRVLFGDREMRVAREQD